ncbi:MAG: hypothetical protein LUH19_07605, partial [Lachnospiraceae bacterium]|nr:hypothetical protein [Lachnospiraceae bacterium]
MSIIVLLIFIGIITKGTNQDRRRSDIFKKVIGAYVGISILAGLLSSGGFVSVAVIGLLIWYFTSRKQKSEKDRWQEWQESYDQGRRNAADSKNSYSNSNGGQGTKKAAGAGRFSQTQPDPMSRMESSLL